MPQTPWAQVALVFSCPMALAHCFNRINKVVMQAWSLGNNQLGMISPCEVGPGYTFLTPKCTVGHCQRNAVLRLITGTTAVLRCHKHLRINDSSSRRAEDDSWVDRAAAMPRI